MQWNLQAFVKPCINIMHVTVNMYYRPIVAAAALIPANHCDLLFCSIEQHKLLCGMHLIFTCHMIFVSSNDNSMLYDYGGLVSALRRAGGAADGGSMRTGHVSILSCFLPKRIPPLQRIHPLTGALRIRSFAGKHTGALRISSRQSRSWLRRQGADPHGGGGMVNSPKAARYPGGFPFIRVTSS